MTGDKRCRPARLERTGPRRLFQYRRRIRRVGNVETLLTARDRRAESPPRSADQEKGGGVRPDAVQGEQGRGAGGHRGDDELVETPELAAGELRAPC